jgi:hypothetical protein
MSDVIIIDKWFWISVAVWFLFYFITYLWFSHNMRKFKSKDIKMPKNRFLANFLVLSQTSVWNMDYKELFRLIGYMLLMVLSIFLIVTLIFLLFGWL